MYIPPPSCVKIGVFITNDGLAGDMGVEIPPKKAGGRRRTLYWRNPDKNYAFEAVMEFNVEHLQMIYNGHLYTMTQARRIICE